MGICVARLTTNFKIKYNTSFNFIIMKRMYQIWQWGRCLYCGTKQECEKLKEKWETKCGNIELEILPV